MRDTCSMQRSMSPSNTAYLYVAVKVPWQTNANARVGYVTGIARNDEQVRVIDCLTGGGNVVDARVEAVR